MYGYSLAVFVSPGPSSSGLRADRDRGEIPAGTCVSGEGARTRAAAERSPVSGRSWMSCLWYSEVKNKHRMQAEKLISDCTRQTNSERGHPDWTNKNRKPPCSTDWKNRKCELCFPIHFWTAICELSFY